MENTITSYVIIGQDRLSTEHQLCSINESFSRDRHHISSWNTKSDGTGLSYVNEQVIDTLSDGNTLYAQWSKDFVITTISAGDGGKIILNENETIIGQCIKNFEYGSEHILSAVPNDGYSFKEWNDGSYSLSLMFYGLGEDRKVQAEFGRYKTMSGNFRGSAYGNGTFVVGEYHKGILYSKDGKLWNKTNIYGEYHIYDIAFGNGVFVATAGGYYDESYGGKNYGIYVSNDGINWHKSNDANTTDSVGWRGIIYDTKIINGFFASKNENGILSSSDGEMWTHIATNFDGWTIESMDTIYTRSEAGAQMDPLFVGNALQLKRDQEATKNNAKTCYTPVNNIGGVLTQIVNLGQTSISRFCDGYCGTYAVTPTASSGHGIYYFPANETPKTLRCVWASKFQGEIERFYVNKKLIYLYSSENGIYYSDNIFSDQMTKNSSGVTAPTYKGLIGNNNIIINLPVDGYSAYWSTDGNIWEECKVEE